MKVLLVKPNNLSDHIQPSIGLGFLATAIRDSHEVEILDCIKEQITIDAFSDVVLEKKPDVIGIQCYTFDVPNILKLLRVIKETNKNIITIVGGAHITLNPLEGLKCFGDVLDYAFAGEGENGFPVFLEQLEKTEPSFEQVRGLIWKSKSGDIQENPPELIANLDSLAFPAWDMIHPENYPEAQHGAFFRQFPIAPIITTRGCPFSCTFCNAPKLSGKTLRHHSVDYIIEQIKMLYKINGIREFHIVDDNFTMDIDYAKNICRGIIDSKLDISLATPNGVRMDRLDDELLELMRAAGLYIISIAVESGNNDVLKKMKKGITVEKIKECVQLIRKHKIDISGFFILGFPGETKKTVKETIKLSLELDLIRANYFTYLPLPGTKSYDELVTSGEIKNVDWEHFYFMSAPYTPYGMERSDLLRFKRNAFLLFYFRPKILWKNIKSIKSFGHFMFLLKRFYHWILMAPNK